MNMNRGLFRLWIIFAIIFICLVTLINLNDLKPQTSKFDPTTAKLMLPVECSKARGKLDEDYINNPDKGYCWYELSKFRKLFPEYNDLHDKELTKKLYEKIASQPQGHNPSYWNAINNILCYGIGIPILILILGFSLKWVFSGFKND